MLQKTLPDVHWSNLAGSAYTNAPASSAAASQMVGLANHLSTPQIVGDPGRDAEEGLAWYSRWELESPLYRSETTTGRHYKK